MLVELDADSQRMFRLLGALLEINAGSGITHVGDPAVYLTMN